MVAVSYKTPRCRTSLDGVILAAVDDSRCQSLSFCFFFQAEDGIRDIGVTGVQTCALPIFEGSSAGAIVLKGKDLEALPDDPDELAAALQALAGPAAGPNGGQITIDGFEGGRVPSRDAIREVRVNDNPLSAENDRPGFGGIQIFTKPGTEKLRGSFGFTFNDEALNSRNPFLRSEKRPPFQWRQYSGNLSGTIIPKKMSFFVDVNRGVTDDNDLVNGFILEPDTPLGAASR